MQIYIVLCYNEEYCKVMKVHSCRSSAKKNAERLQQIYSHCTFHVIKKKVYGEVLIPASKIRIMLNPIEKDEEGTVNKGDKITFSSNLQD